MIHIPLGRCTPWKVPLYPLNSSLDGHRSCSERSEEDKRLFPLPGFEPPIFQTVQCFLERKRSFILKKFNIRRTDHVSVFDSSELNSENGSKDS